jgi:lambda repressor-like predicted transcriptional regulator
MSARKIQDETEAREHIAKMRKSGPTLAAWARSAGTDGRSLHAFNVKLSRGDTSAIPKPFSLRQIW